MSDSRGNLLRKPLVPVTVTLAALAVVVWGIFGPGSETSAPHRAAAGGTVRPGVHMVQALERLPSDSLSEWVSVADHVVAVTVTGEEPLERQAPGGQPGEAEDSSSTSKADETYEYDRIDRKVTLQVNEILWSSPSAARTLSETVTIPTSAGWIRHADGSLSEAAVVGAARLEIGHDYTVALVWQPAICKGDYRLPASWQKIGSGAVLPAEDGVIGVGEFEGTVATSLEDGGEPVGPAVVDRFEGEGVGALEAALADTVQTETVEDVPDDLQCES